MRSDTHKMKGVTDYVALPLKVDHRHNVQTPKNEQLYDSDSEVMVRTVLVAIKELEDKIL